MKESRIMPIPEFFWSGMAIFASSTMESVGGADNFFQDQWYPYSYGFFLLCAIALSMRNALHAQLVRAQIIRVILFYLGVTGMAVFLEGDLSRIAILAIGLVYFLVPIRRKRDGKTMATTP